MNHFSKNKNNLVNTLSPYLKQHSNNPVNWFPWSQRYLDQAQNKKLMIVSIGYAACHWCHVMAHESFENDSIAALMNNFINIR